MLHFVIRREKEKMDWVLKSITAWFVIAGPGWAHAVKIFRKSALILLYRREKIYISPHQVFAYRNYFEITSLALWVKICLMFHLRCKLYKDFLFQQPWRWTGVRESAGTQGGGLVFQGRACMCVSVQTQESATQLTSCLFMHSPPI